MLVALKERREEIEEYVQILEEKVRERTTDLVESEEKYRTFVENVPLIVYRILREEENMIMVKVVLPVRSPVFQS
jgi:hypothetical protein